MQVFISSENGVCPPGAVLLDSCTSHFVSGSGDDFKHMIDTPARITGATGSSNNGRIGILRENILGLKTGIFYPDLHVERIVSKPILNSMGWTCILSATNSSSQYSSASTSSSTTIDQDSRSILRRGTVEIPVINRKGALPYVENVLSGEEKPAEEWATYQPSPPCLLRNLELVQAQGIGPERREVSSSKAATLSDITLRIS